MACGSVGLRTRPAAEPPQNSSGVNSPKSVISPACSGFRVCENLGCTGSPGLSHVPTGEDGKYRDTGKKQEDKHCAAGNPHLAYASGKEKRSQWKVLNPWTAGWCRKSPPHRDRLRAGAQRTRARYHRLWETRGAPGLRAPQGPPLPGSEPASPSHSAQNDAGGPLLHLGRRAVLGGWALLSFIVRKMRIIIQLGLLRRPRDTSKSLIRTEWHEHLVLIPAARGYPAGRSVTLLRGATWTGPRSGPRSGGPQTPRCHRPRSRGRMEVTSQGSWGQVFNSRERK